MVHLHHRLDRIDAVRGFQCHQLVVDAVVQLLIILIKGKLTQTEQRPPLVDRRHVRLCQDLFGILQTCLLILTVVGDLHQFLQVVARTLVGEVLMTELHRLLKAFLSHLIILFLQGVHRSHMQDDVTTPVTVLVLRVVVNLIGNFLCRSIILMGRLIDGLVAPGLIKQAFVSVFLAYVFQLFCCCCKTVTFRSTDQS